MLFKINCKDEQGSGLVYYYDNSLNVFLRPDKTPIIPDRDPNIGRTLVNRIGPSNHGLKSNKIDILKIQLGLKCNKTCSYCSQDEFTNSGSITTLEDIDNLINFIKSKQIKPNRIEIWGGEPLVYKKKLIKLIEAFYDYFPNINFFIISNGLLLDNEWLEFFLKYDRIILRVSHDGPGQALYREEDGLFDDSERLEVLKTLADKRKGRFGFNFVITPNNCDFFEIEKFFKNKLDMDVHIVSEGIVGHYSDVANSIEWTDEKYKELQENIINYVGLNRGINNIFNYKFTELSRLTGVKEEFLSQKCGMDLPNILAVDLKGNVLTCQNTNGEKHIHGNISDLESVTIDNIYHWAHRENCQNCAVLYLCRGGCMFVEGENFQRSCTSYYYFNIIFLFLYFHSLTGYRVESIENGFIPSTRKNKTIIPLKVV